MAVFELSIRISPIEKKLGREPIKIALSEWEMNSLIKALSVRNKSLYGRVMKELIEVAKDEGYQMMLGSQKVKVKCPHCEGEVEV